MKATIDFFLHPIPEDFTCIEIAACIVDAGNNVRRVSDNETPEFWTVYYRTANGESQAIADFTIKACAMTFAEFINSVIEHHKPQKP